MSRIRSLHPTQWTDEQFVVCSPLARLLAIGIRNEADDHGVFEWKPLTIKMRLLPGDNCDVSALLDELILSEQVSRFTAEGKQFGIIRNFMTYQRPKKPVYRFPVPPEFPTGTEPVPPKSELGPQMEDEEKEEGEDPPTPLGDFDRFWELYPHKVEEDAARLALDRALLIASIDEICVGTIIYRDTKPPTQAWKRAAGWLDKRRWKDRPAGIHVPKVVTFRAASSTPSLCSYDEMKAKQNREGAGLKPISVLAPTVILEVEGSIS